MLSVLRSSNAFTIMEIIVVIGMCAIISAVAAPPLMEQLGHQKVKAAARDISSRFQRTRLDAAKENEVVAIRFSPGAYAPEGGVGGYQIFLDDGAGGGIAGNLVQDGSESTIASVAMPQGVSLISAAFTDGINTINSAGFDGYGLPAGLFIGNVQLRTSDRWYRVSLSVAGSIKMEISGDGINWSL